MHKMGNSHKTEPTWNAGHMLDVHILDYLKKRNLPETAAAFKKECHISEKPRAIDTTSGFLVEWWTIFWDIYVARTNPSYSQYANTYTQAQKAKPPHWQQQQQVQQMQSQQLQMQQQLQQQMIAQQLMQERNLPADHAARIAEQVTLNRLRNGNGALGQSLQDQMSARLQERTASKPQHLPFQGTGKAGLEGIGRGLGGLGSPPPESRASSAGAEPSQHRNTLAAAIQATQRANDQGNLCNETNLEALLGGSYPHPSQQPPQASPWPNISPALAQRDSLNLSASLPDGISPELRHQAIQKLQQQQQQQLLQQQQDRQLMMGQGKGSGEVALALGADANGNNSRQSSASMQRFPQSPTLAQTQQQQQQRLTASQILYLQQNLQAQQNEGSLSKGQGLPSGPQNPEFRHLLAQFNPNGLFKQQVPGLKLEGFIPTHGVPGQDLASAVQLAQKSQSFAQLRMQDQQMQQQQDRAGQPHMQSSSPQLQPGHPQLQPARGLLQDFPDGEGCMGTDSGPNDKSPASSAAGASSLHKNGRAATPGPTSSQGVSHAGTRVNGRGAKPANVAAANKKRKHNNVSSRSESQGTPPDSSVSRDSGSNKGPSRPPSSSKPLTLSNVDWDMHSMHSMGKMKGTLSSSMNAAAAALDDCPDPLHFTAADLMNDDLTMDQHLLLNGDGDVHDTAFL